MNYINYNLYPGSSGVRLKLYTGIDLTGATTLQMIVKKPDDTEVTWTATIDGTDSKYMVYEIQPGDLDQSGEYLVRSYIQKGTLDTPGRLVALKVHPLWDNE